MVAHSVRIRALALLVPVLTSACSRDATGPASKPGRAGINIVGGSGVTDTIDARLTAPLVVRVLDESGNPVAGARVGFSPVLVAQPGVNYFVASAFVQRHDALSATYDAIDTTDADGRVSIRVILGRVPAAGGIIVHVLARALTDTARYTTLPGAPAVSTASPAENIITAGGTLALVASTTDRYRNRLPGQPSLRLTNDGISVSATGIVTTTSPARTGVIASSGATRPETSWVSVVPRGTMAAAVSGQIAIMELDGSARRTIPTTLGASDPEWTVDGSALLSQLAPNSAGGSLYRVGLDATAALVLNAGAPFVGSVAYVPAVIYGFAPMRDGSLLSAAGGCNYSAILFRTPHGSTSQGTRLSPPAASDCFETVHHFPSPSPDSRRLVFEHRTSYFTGSSLRLLDLATGVVTTLHASGQRPRWSPRGDLIAFTDNQRIWVIAPDGSGLRAVSTASRSYSAGVSWSPDGRWLLARLAPAPGMITVLEEATGLEIPLSYTRAAFQNSFGIPVWRPVP